ncbi:cell division protein ZapA [Dyadobacter jejuensis]|uniref:Cell division protein ZapA n=1 Tax=Dyadobacter jejuensis TaxID=1082580 RepID=A0A316AML0_9BACT|nr:cell division protein ZapA [Dyadobacter jejuensis]PWJ58529.1 cell division protein ZapA [Dyadobacter jejuensis]
MKKNSISNPDVSVFIKFMDKGFKLSVPADQERYYREGYEVFIERVEQHKSKKNGYDDIEAIGLTAIECLVALQRMREEMDGLTEAFQGRMERIEETVTSAIES